MKLRGPGMALRPAENYFDSYAGSKIRFNAALSLIGGAGFRPQRTATIRSTNLRTAAIPLHGYPDSPGGLMSTQPPAVSACARFL